MYDLERVKPVHYNLEICFGGFDGDTMGYDAGAPFLLPRVGDFIDQRRCPQMAPGWDFLKNQLLQVTAVKHSFVDRDSHIDQYISVSVEVGSP